MGPKLASDASPRQMSFHASVCRKIDSPIDNRPPETRPLEAGLSALVPALTVGLLGLAGGGFEPTAQNWATLALIACSAASLVALGLPRPGSLELVLLGSLALLGAWTLLSSAWSLDRAQAILEGQRLALYVAGTLAVLLAARRWSVGYVLGALLAAISAVCVYGLSLRLFPDSPDSGGVVLSTDPQAAFRLAEPLGYSNALGALAAVGIALGLVLGTLATWRPGRALAGASLPLLAATLYLTFGRGAWLALAVGFSATLALSPRRLQLVAGLTALSIAPALAVLIASQSDGLSVRGADLGQMETDGRRLAVALVLLAGLGAASALAFRYAEDRVRPGPRLRAAFAATLIAVGAAAIVAGAIVAGGPSGVYDAFNAQPAPAESDVEQRLLTFSGSSRSDYWRIAWEDFEDNPLLGSGAGSYQRRWLEHRPAELPVRDAHSLYLETLAELGPVGLALLLVALTAPLAAALRARASPLVPAALAAYCCYLAHAAIDWDWEMPAVTFAGLVAGCALLVAARRDDATVQPSRRFLAAALAAGFVSAALTTVALAGNRALEQSADALERDDTAEAKRQARRAARWAPWASEPWRLQGEAQLAEGDLEAARRSFRKGIVKDDRSWELWLDLALASEGGSRRAALSRARALNPLERAIRGVEGGE